MNLYSYDLETHLIQPGLTTPPIVCGSLASTAPGDERVFLPEEARLIFRALIQDPQALIGGSNIGYDLGCMAADNPTLVDAIFDAVEAGRTADLKVLEALNDNATGFMGLDPADPSGNTPQSYSLAALETRYLGIDRKDQKSNGWRLKYALLDGVPLEDWPDEAIQYPRADARGGVDVLKIQLGPDRANLQCLDQEMRAAWALRLSQIWGMRTDEVMVPVLVSEIRRKHEESRRKFFEHGIVRVRPCKKNPPEERLTKGEHERSDDIGLGWLDQAGQALVQLASKDPTAPTWITRRLADLEACRKALAKGRPIRFAEDKGLLKELVEVAYAHQPPLTSGGASGNQQTSTNRDTLTQSGDPLLEEYGEAGPNEKILSTYVPVLEQGIRVPICPSFDSIKATQRTSYWEPNLQQLPRKGQIREAFVPRGYVHEEVPDAG